MVCVRYLIDIHDIHSLWTKLELELSVWSEVRRTICKFWQQGKCTQALNALPTALLNFPGWISSALPVVLVTSVHLADLARPGCRTMYLGPWRMGNWHTSWRGVKASTNPMTSMRLYVIYVVLFELHFFGKRLTTFSVT